MRPRLLITPCISPACKSGEERFCIERRTLLVIVILSEAKNLSSVCAPQKEREILRFAQNDTRVGRFSTGCECSEIAQQHLTIRRLAHPATGRNKGNQRGPLNG